MRKRGMSQVIVIMLVIVVSLLAITLFWMFVKTFIEKQNVEAKFGEFLNCIQDADIEILDVCYENNLLKMQIKNKGELILGDFFLIDITFQNQSTERIPTPYNTYIGPYKTKIIIVPYKTDIIKIKVIPQIEKQIYLCPDSAPEYANIKECVGG